MLPSAYLIADHKRLDSLLNRADADGVVDAEIYDAFRAAQFRHIAIEETIVLPCIVGRYAGGCFSVQQIQLEHKAIAALLALTPAGDTLPVLRALLEKHKLLEETNRTLHDVLDERSRTDQPELLTRMQDYPTPDIPPLPGDIDVDRMTTARDAVSRAGYQWETLSPLATT